jgi:hypothetical protein
MLPSVAQSIPPVAELRRGNERELYTECAPLGVCE